MIDVGIGIYNNRMASDYACLPIDYWSGMQQGKDGYPLKAVYGDFFIAGGKDMNFKSIIIEIYGINI